ncbi:MAG: cyclic nucleotide-binding/CBS domain-containing protein [Nitrososphaerales archaeon]
MTAPVESLMSKKLVTVETSATAFDVSREMLDHDIGCILVLEKKKLAGIVTKSDILREAVMKRLDPQKIVVTELMTRPVVTIGSDRSLADASALMSKHNITKIPVLSGGQLVGIITSTDLVRRMQPKKLAKDMI